MITYEWQPKLMELLSNRGGVFSLEELEEVDRDGLRIYTQRLAEITNNPAHPSTISLVDILGPMFEFAQYRGGDPVKENGTAILVSVLYIMDMDIITLFDSKAGSIPRKRHHATLSDRRDFAKHFLASTAITIRASTCVTDTLGLKKEIENSSAGSSGFSFAELDADRAGVRFAELAISTHQNAVLVQKRLANNLSEPVLIPGVTGLLEFMSEDNIYGGVNQPQFQNVIKDIEEKDIPAALI